MHAPSGIKKCSNTRRDGRNISYVDLMEFLGAVARQGLLPKYEELQLAIWKDLEDVLLQESLIWAQKARAEWSVYGDRNTRYFHARANHRRKSKKIEAIKDAAGNWVFDTVLIKDLATSFFSNLLSEDVLNRPTLECHMSYPCVEESEKSENVFAEEANDLARSRKKVRMGDAMVSNDRASILRVEDWMTDDEEIREEEEVPPRKSYKEACVDDNATRDVSDDDEEWWFGDGWKLRITVEMTAHGPNMIVSLEFSNQEGPGTKTHPLLVFSSASGPVDPGAGGAGSFTSQLNLLADDGDVDMHVVGVVQYLEVGLSSCDVALNLCLFEFLNDCYVMEYKRCRWCLILSVALRS
ncbi:hypothetical protein K1719_042764 [Acacia pycnantha]|nr:hypothetical protein K1719_042764 [Acacia pycnantha]